MSRRRCRFEVDRLWSEDQGKRYVVLHLCGPSLSWRDPDSSRSWRLWWDAEYAPMFCVRGMLFGRAFLIEVAGTAT